MTRPSATLRGRNTHRRDGLLAMGDLLFERHHLAGDLVEGQVQRRLRIRSALARLEHWRAVAVEGEVDPAYLGRQPASLGPLGDLDLGVGGPSKVAGET